MYKYKRDSSVFSKKTLNICYWAGFIAADGSVNTNSLRMCLSKKDKNHLLKLKEFIKYEGVLYDYGIKTNIQLDIYDKQIVKDLYNNFNIKSHKSLTLEPPKDLTYDQELAFIIGYIDGDGVIGINSFKKKDKTYKYLRLRIIGTPIFLKWVNKIFNKNNKPKIHNKSKIHIISFSNLKLIKKLNNFRLENKLPVLSRKWNKV